MNWICIKEFPRPKTKRVLIFTPDECESRQYREIDVQFLSTCCSATHYVELHPPGGHHE